jgi:AmiR/NasT family two-component response regulator
LIHPPPINTAIGILLARDGMTEDAALDLMQAEALEAGVTLAQYARALVEAFQPPDE